MSDVKYHELQKNFCSICKATEDDGYHLETCSTIAPLIRLEEREKADGKAYKRLP